MAEPKQFEFDLMVQTLERDAQQKSKEEQKVERLSVLEGLRKHPSEYVLLVGRPGSGKSTAGRSGTTGVAKANSGFSDEVKISLVNQNRAYEANKIGESHSRVS